MSCGYLKIKGFFLLCFLSVIILTAVSFLPCLNNGFVKWDDPLYLLENPSVRGLSLEHIGDIFTSFINGNYQPLTVLSFAVEYHFFQYTPWIYHLNNVIVHIINTVLVFYCVFCLTGKKFSAFLVMVLFAIHPTRVESVAWVTERKDVLFTLFYLLSLMQYLFYLNKREIKNILCCFLFFLLALLSKPAAVSLPLVLLLMDYHSESGLGKREWLEKIPFVFLSLIFGVIAIYAARIPFPEHYPYLPEFSFINRIFLSSVALYLYIYKLFIPSDLSAFYPLPSASAFLPPFYYISGFMYVFLVWIWIQRSRLPKNLFFGMCFFVLTILFNLHYYFVGRVLIADRFTYLPYIGLFLIISQVCELMYQRHKLWLEARKGVFLLCLFMVLFFLSYHTSIRCGVWRNNITLWSDVITKFPQEPMGYFNRADSWMEQKRWDRALADYSRGLQLLPQYARAYCARANVYVIMGQYQKALNDYDRALVHDPRDVNTYFNKAALYRMLENYDASLRNYDMILKIDPQNAAAKKHRQVLLDQISKPGVNL